MSKSQLCWLLIRVAGLGCVVASIRGLFQMVFFAYFLASHAYQDINDKVSNRITFDSVWPSAFWGVVLLCLGLYLLFRGAGVHRLLMRED